METINEDYTHAAVEKLGRATAGLFAVFAEVVRVPYLVLVNVRATPLNVTALDIAAGAITSNEVVPLRSPLNARVPAEEATDRTR